MTDQTALFLTSFSAFACGVALVFQAPDGAVSWQMTLGMLGIGCGVPGMLRSSEARP